MPNPLVKYREQLKDWPTWLPQTMPEPFDDIPELPGFDLGPADVHAQLQRLTAKVFTESTLYQVWTNVPANVRNELINVAGAVMAKIAENGSDFANVAAASIQGLASGVAVVGNMVGASIDFANSIVASIHKTLETNDQNRRDERLKLVEGLMGLGPAAWTISPWGMRTYKREIKYKKDQFPSVWPPDYTSGYGSLGPLLLEGAPERKGDCARGDADFSGGYDSSCRGWMRIFPIFFPVWCTASLGSYQKSLRGMERSNDAGAAVWANIVAMQAAMLANPIANLQASGDYLRKTWERFQIFFWARYFKPPEGMMNHGGKEKGLRNIGLDDDETRYVIASTFDPEFPAGLKKGFYLTPGGQIGTYAFDGSGTTDHPDLHKVGVYRWDSANTYGDFGNWITAADYNTVRSACGQFFALRMATLRRQSTMRAIVEEFPELLEKQELPSDDQGNTELRYPIREKSVREAVKASAAGATDDTMILKTIPARMPNIDVVPADVLPSGGGAGALLGLAALGGLAFAASRR